ncbi:MAG: diaminopimelate epimerase [Longimicrobiales bacterium]|nr:diaminopimelate epimerase [Longimicrobiales bacterium]
MRQPLSLGSGFFKGHGHGNDYLVFEQGDAWHVTAKSVQAICHRHRGVGGDGIVALLSGEASAGRQERRVEESSPPPFRLRMFNPDGSEFERSGNGLRVLGAYLFSKGVVEVKRTFPVEVGGETVGMEILGEELGGLLNVAVEMGRARFGIDAVGGRPEMFGIDSTLIGPDGTPLEVHLVSMGNPHCVVIRDELREKDLLELGPFLAANRAFTAGTNVQLAQLRGTREVEILIWERGVGRTASSGTSACAVASACVRRGLLQEGKIRVGMEGGSFTVEVSPQMTVRLEGPVQPLLTGELTQEFLAGLT